LLKEIRAAVADGKSLTETLRQFPEVFPPLHTAMIQAGERAAFMEEVLRSLAGFIERFEELRSKVMGALIYPALLAGLGAVVMLGALTMSHDDDGINAAGKKRGSREFLQGFVSLLKNKALILIASSSAVRSMTQTGLLTFLPVYLAYELGYSPLAVGICLTLLQVTGFVAAPIAGHLSDKLGRKSVITGSMTLTALTIVGMALAGKSIVFIIFIALIGFFLYATRAVIQAWAVESTPKHLAGSGVGLLFGTQAIGSSISPVIFGMIADNYGIHAGFYFLASTVVVSNLLVYLVPASPVAQDKPAAV